MTHFLEDCRFALRQMQHSPGFAFIAVLTIALGIGAASSVFSVVYALVIRPLPFTDPGRIVYPVTYSPQGYTQPSSYPEYLDWRRENNAFSSLAAFTTSTGTLSNNETPISVPLIQASDNFFDVFGVRASIGRTFRIGEDQTGQNHVAVISYELWQQTFGKSVSVIGQDVHVNGQLYQIIGVMPAGFRYPISRHNAIYIPFNLSQKELTDRGNHSYPTLGRLRDGVSLHSAQADMTNVLDNVGRAYPDQSKGRKVRLETLNEHVLGKTGEPLKVLSLAILALLIIACVNITGLLLARAVKRQREVALRLAIGANRGRLIQQFLTEAVLLALIGGGSGIAIGYGLLLATRALVIASLAQGADVHMNGPVMCFSLLLSIGTAVLAGILPALRLSATAPGTALRGGSSAGTGKRQHRLRSAFVVTQLALALVLVVTAGLLLKTLSGLRGTSLGFNPAVILTQQVSYVGAADHDPRIAFFDPLIEEVSHLPGVEAAGLIELVPVQQYGTNTEVNFVGRPPSAPNQERLAEIREVTPGYFAALDIKLVRGRMFDSRLDTPKSQPVVIVNSAFVRKFFPNGEDPIGQQIKREAPVTIVGVTSSVRQNLYQEPMAEMDLPISQFTQGDAVLSLHETNLILRSRLPPSSLSPRLRSVFNRLDPTVPIHSLETMQDVLADSLVFERLESWLFGAFAVVAGGLAIIGLFGLITQQVEASTREIGIRLALGASRSRILADVYRRVGVVLILGSTLGIFCTLMTRRVIASVVSIGFEHDAPVIAALTSTLVIAGLIAALIPARRAASVNPIEALKSE